MLEAFHLGGWGMYPTMIAGLFLVRAAILYKREPSRERLPVLIILSLITLAAGSLGFVTGLMTTLRFAAGEPNQGELIAMGTFESLHNLAFALCFLVFGGIIAAVGAWRPRPSPEPVSHEAHAHL
jgi:hypothetical protein